MRRVMQGWRVRPVASDKAPSHAVVRPAFLSMSPPVRPASGSWRSPSQKVRRTPRSSRPLSPASANKCRRSPRQGPWRSPSSACSGSVAPPKFPAGCSRPGRPAYPNSGSLPAACARTERRCSPPSGCRGARVSEGQVNRLKALKRSGMAGLASTSCAFGSSHGYDLR